jgi:hypothetical protein
MRAELDLHPGKKTSVNHLAYPASAFSRPTPSAPGTFAAPASTFYRFPSVSVFQVTNLVRTYLNIIAELKERGISSIERVGLPQPRSILQGTVHCTLKSVSIVKKGTRAGWHTLQSRQTPNRQVRTYPSTSGFSFHSQSGRHCRYGPPHAQHPYCSSSPFPLEREQSIPTG